MSRVGDDWFPIQVKQKDKAGRPDIDSFEAVMTRENRTLGISSGSTIRPMRSGRRAVGRSKTKGGEGRVVPINQDAFAALTQWRQCFDNPLPSHFVFPSERYGLDGEAGHKSGAVVVWDRDPEKAIGSWKVAWGACRTAAKVECRLHDLRHTLVSRLAEAQTADHTIMALAGHMSRKMMERHSHARNEAKRKAVEGLFGVEIRRDSPQNPPRSETETAAPTQ